MFNITNEEAIKWLELQKSKGIAWDDYSEETRYIREQAEMRIAASYDKAIEALRRGM